MATISGGIAILSWGLLASLSVFSSQVQPFQLLAICFFIGSSLIYLYRIFRQDKLFVKPKMNACQWLIGIVGIFGFHFLYFLAIRYAPAMEVSLIAYLWPLFLGILVAPKSLLVCTALGGILGFLGVIVIIKDNIVFGFSDANIIGYLFAFCCALIWSSYSWFISVYKSDTSDIAWVTLACGVLAFIAHLLLEEPRWAFSNTECVAMVLLGLGPMGGAFYLWEIGMKAGNKRLLASFSFFTPVISAIALYAFGMGDFSSGIIAALILILLGAMVTNSKRLKY